jgi:hypothetical protein
MGISPATVQCEPSPVRERDGVRLYLSSFRMGRCPNRPGDLMRGDRRRRHTEARCP